MALTPQRRAALRLCLATLALVCCAFLWLAAVSFDPADWPSTGVWHAKAQVRNACGPSGAWLAWHGFYQLGIGVHVLLAVLTLGAWAWARGMRVPDLWLRAIGAGLLVTVASAAGAMLPAVDGLLTRFTVTGAGGVLGIVTADFLMARLDALFTIILLGCGGLVGILLTADELFFGASRGLAEIGRRSVPVISRGGSALAHAGAAVAAGVTSATDRLARRAANGQPQPDPAPRRNGRNRVLARLDEDLDEPGDAVPPRAKQPIHPAVPAVDRATDDDDEVDEEDVEAFEPEQVDDAGDDEAGETDEADGPVVTDLTRKPSLPPPRPAAPRPMADGAPPYELPSLTLLDEPEPIDRRSIEILCREKAYVLEQTLNEFRLEVRVVAIETGPVITVFELRLAPGIKVSQIASLSNDIARALKAPAVRVVAPLPGKNTIGIEVPNVDKEKVRLKDLMLAMEGRIDPQGIPLFLGKDASGAPLVSDLTRMPHLLIAGTTGSGKSVCVSSIIMSILLTKGPAEVNLVLVDPKVVELAMFKDIPHLMCPIVTETQRAEGILDWAATKMDERYALLAEAGVKDIRSYNRLGPELLRERMQIESDEELAAIPAQLPYIVIVIDELADLMMTSPKEVEFHLCRLAQKSRAVGIHLIVSTQRPQANVVTGLIKSNLPCRIAFRVASRLDSRIVLDQNGGEVLMGQGDMLFLPPGSSKLMRAQGAYVSDEELRAIVRHARGQGQPTYHPELIRIPRGGGEGGGERDELFDQAVDIIIESGRGSVSLLQRRLTIGYSRASRLIDQMCDSGIVGEYKGSQAREVILSKEEWQQVRAARNREEAAEGVD